MDINARKSSFVFRYAPLAVGLFVAGCAQGVSQVSQQTQLAALGDNFQIDGPASVQVATLREAARKIGNVCLVPDSVLLDPDYDPLFCRWERPDDTNSAFSNSGNSRVAGSVSAQASEASSENDNPSDDGTDNPGDSGADNPGDSGTDNPDDSGTDNPDDSGADNPDDSGADNPGNGGGNNGNGGNAIKGNNGVGNGGNDGSPNDRSDTDR